MQTWKINGQVYTHGQLMEMRAQGLDPHKDKIAMKFITTGKKGEKKAVKQQAVPAVEIKDEKAEVPEAAPKTDYRSMKFFDLKKIAADKGMEVTKETKKAAILAFLEK
jgi:hypothetical protein